MAVTNFLVSGLSAYVEENRDLIIKDFALSNRGTRGRVGLQTGVKGTMNLHSLDVDPVIQSAADCGFNPLDEVTLGERPITVVPMKHDGQICDKTLLGKYAQYLVRINATEQEFPFERFVIEALTNALNKKIENMIWQASITGGDLIDGWLTKFAADTNVLTVSIASGSGAYAGIQAVYAAIPEEAIERGAAIFVSPAIFRVFMMEVVAANLYHYAGPGNQVVDEFYLPGTGARVISTPGLANSLKIVGTFADNLVYGTDMENDAEDFDIWFSKDDRLWKWTSEWASGVSYHLPDQIVVGTFAAAPVPPVPCICSSDTPDA